MSTVTPADDELAVGAVEIHAFYGLVIAMALVTVNVAGAIRVIVVEEINVLIIVCAKNF